MRIKAIVWDLGGVIVRTEDYSARERLATRYGMSISDLEEIAFGGQSGNQGQRGEIDVDRHWENVAQLLSLSKSEVKPFIDAFFSGDRVDEELIDYIRDLRANYKTALLSNAFSNVRYFVEEVWKFADAFDHMIISSEVGIVKPDAKIYQLALERLEVLPGEAVFIDDFQHNIEGARAVGLQAIHFRTVDQVYRDLGALLELGEDDG